jgi:hypothetical protein
MLFITYTVIVFIAICLFISQPKTKPSSEASWTGLPPAHFNCKSIMSTPRKLTPSQPTEDQEFAEYIGELTNLGMPEPTPIQPEPQPQVEPEPTLEQLQELAKANKVKGWNLYRNPTSLALKLTELGIL